MEVSPRTHFHDKVLPRIPGASKVSNTKAAAAKVFSEAVGFIPSTETTNQVYKIGNVAFLKAGRNGENGSAIMEALVWEIASIFEVDDLFAPTGTIVITPRKGEKLGLDTDAICSIQAPAEGMHLETVVIKKIPLSDLTDEPEIAMQNLIKAHITSLVFGMMDAHAKNIFVGSGATFKFIDNCMSFPNSDTAISKGQTVHLTYRSSLIELPECHKSLTVEQKKYLSTLLQKINANFPKFEKYIRSDEVQQKISKLPKRWFDTDKVILATKKRIDRLIEATKKDHIQTLTDYAFEAIPFYRLYTLFFLIKYDLSEITPFEAWCIGSANGTRMNLTKGLKRCKKKGVNPMTLLMLTKKPKFSYEDCLKSLAELKKVSLLKGTKCLTHFARSMINLAELDLKDIPADRVDEFIKTFKSLHRP